MLDPSTSSPGLLELTFNTLTLNTLKNPSQSPCLTSSTQQPTPPPPLLTLHTLLSNGQTSTTTLPYSNPEINVPHKFNCFIFPKTLTNLTLSSTISYTSSDDNRTDTFVLGKIYIPEKNLHSALKKDEVELQLYDNPLSPFGSLTYTLSFTPLTLHGYDQDLTLEYTPSTLSIYILASNIPRFSEVIIRLRPVRLGKRVTSFPYYVTRVGGVFNEFYEVEMPLHVGKR